MSETTTTTAEATETGTEATKTEAPETETTDTDQLPADHPLVKTLASQKAEIRDLKVKAKRLAEIEESQKSEAEKTADRITKAEAEVASIPAKVAEALKTHLVALHSFDAEDAELFLTATEPELLLKQVTRLLGQSDKRQRKNHVAREGANPTAEPTSDMREFTRQLFGGGN